MPGWRSVRRPPRSWSLFGAARRLRCGRRITAPAGAVCGDWPRIRRVDAHALCPGPSWPMLRASRSSAAARSTCARATSWHLSPRGPRRRDGRHPRGDAGDRFYLISEGDARASIAGGGTIATWVRAATSGRSRCSATFPDRHRDGGHRFSAAGPRTRRVPGGRDPVEAERPPGKPRGRPAPRRNRELTVTSSPHLSMNPCGRPSEPIGGAPLSEGTARIPIRAAPTSGPVSAVAGPSTSPWDNRPDGDHGGDTQAWTSTLLLCSDPPAPRRTP